MQAYVPAEMRGRVFTLMDLSWSLMRLLSLGIGGVAVELFGVRVVFYVGGGLLMASGIIGLLFLCGHRIEEREGSALG